MSSGISGALPESLFKCTVFLEESDDFLSSQELDTWDGFFVSDGNTDL
jgi:hypothetical protein